MNLLWVTRYHSSKSLGGTEKYIDRLYAKMSRIYQVKILFIGSDKDEVIGDIIHSSINSEIFDTSVCLTKLNELNFIIEDYVIDLVHFHTLGIAEFYLASVFQRPYGFTYHTPSWTCRRGDLLLNGSNDVCDGYLHAERCTKCLIKSRFRDRSNVVRNSFLENGFAHLAMLALKISQNSNYVQQKMFQDSLRRFLSECVFGVYPALWCKSVLMLNGLKENKLWHIPQAAADDFKPMNDFKRNHESIRLLYVGRIAEIKGLNDILRLADDISFSNTEIHLFGFKDLSGRDSYERKILSEASNLGIETFAFCSEHDLNVIMENYDAVIIPSKFPETGPMTYFEAKRKGLFILCSDRVGQLEESYDTYVYKSGNITDMRKKYRQMREAITSDSHDKRNQSKTSNVSHRTFDDVCLEHQMLYEKVY